MERKLFLIFIIIILMPITVITVMVFNTYKNGNAIEKENLKKNATRELIAADRMIQNSFRTIERELISISFNRDMTDEDLRSISKKSKLVRQLFIIDDDKKFIFPPENGLMSERERDFIEEAGKIDLINTLGAKTLQNEKINTTSEWYTWFMGDGINFIYFNNMENLLKGYLIERYALISELINTLPVSDKSDNDFRVILLDARGDIFYQWGNYTPEEGQTSDAEIALTAPMGSWRFRYYYAIEKNRTIVNFQNYIIIFGLTIMTVLILFLAYYFYRENSKAMKIAGQKVSFVNQVSHEFKTPLTNIRLYSELLQGKINEKKNLEYLDVIINEGSRLGRLINNVLVFGRGERGELKKRIEKVDLNSLIIKVLEKFAPLLKDNKMESFYMEIDLPLIETDADMVEQIIGNLVSNAIKYGSSGKYLSIEANSIDTGIHIKIHDKGPGIPLKEKEHIFKPFYRISNSLSEGVSGTGIGLSIARTLSRETGIILKLEDSDVGAVFSLTIPYQRNNNL